MNLLTIMKKLQTTVNIPSQNILSVSKKMLFLHTDKTVSFLIQKKSIYVRLSER